MSVAMRGRNRFFCSSLPQRSSALLTRVFCTSTTTPADASTRESSSTARIASKNFAPPPPYCSGISIPIRPSWKNSSRSFFSTSPFSSISLTRGRILSSANWRMLSRKRTSSSVSVVKGAGGVASKAVSDINHLQGCRIRKLLILHRAHRPSLDIRIVGSVPICLRLAIFLWTPRFHPFGVFKVLKAGYPVGRSPYMSEERFAFPVENVPIFDKAPYSNEESPRFDFRQKQIIGVIVESQKSVTVRRRTVGTDDRGQRMYWKPSPVCEVRFFNDLFGVYICHTKVLGYEGIGCPRKCLPRNLRRCKANRLRLWAGEPMASFQLAASPVLC